MGITQLRPRSKPTFLSFTLRLGLICISLFGLSLSNANNGAFAAEKSTLLIMGDSLSAGYGIPTETSWAYLLAKKLKITHPDVILINDSISGETTAGGLARLSNTLQNTQIGWVLIELGANDGLRGQSLKAMSKNLSRMIHLIRQHHAKPLLAGIRLPPNYGKRYIEGFNGVFQDLAEKEHVPLLPFLLDGVGGKTTLMQKDGLHPNQAAQSIIMNNVYDFLDEHLYP